MERHFDYSNTINQQRFVIGDCHLNVASLGMMFWAMLVASFLIK